MHLCHIYCIIKQWIHGDDKSHKLIKIVHICGRWMVDGGNGIKQSFYESLSPLFGYHEDMAIYIFFLFFSWTLMCPFFFFFSFFWVMLLGHAIFSLFFFGQPMPHLKDTRERERSLNMEFYFVDGWNGIANFQCRSSAGGVHMILIKHV